MHEPVLTKFIETCCDSEYSDFLIDIGANIGLTTCQNGNAFKEVVCFEPNPLCVNVLKVNTEIAIDGPTVEINEYGLGAEEGKFELWMAKNNWGGGFVRNAQNTYSDDTLAIKDGFKYIDDI